MEPEALIEWMRSRAPDREGMAHRPRHFDLTVEDDREALAELVREGAVAGVADTIDAQLRDLLETREPRYRLSEGEVKERTRGLIGDRPLATYGRWVFYPWTGLVVHVLPPAEFVELRTSRNRNKITADEQDRLRALTLGVAGLSVGQTTAVTLALEGTGGRFRLADFDHLDLSNLNRLRGSVADLGINKAVLTARRMVEIDPYLDIHLFTDGVTEENIDVFLGGEPGEGALDLLFEECDDLEMKIRLREHARALRIPVLMETSDRGLLDVERFDREPERALLHGLIGDLRADDVRGLSTYEKVPTVMKIIGVNTLSDRFAASMVDIETSLKTWPQLASGVTLGGALNADAARRIALGDLQKSGRYYVDLDRLVSDDLDATVDGAPDFRVEVSPAARNVELPPVPVKGGPLTGDDVRTLVTYGSLAPSGGNVQPWRFRWDGRALACWYDPARSGVLLDYDARASMLAIGAAIENMSWVSGAMGFSLEMVPFPRPEEPNHVADLIFRQTEPDPEGQALVDAVASRATNRRLSEREPLPDEVRTHLQALASARGARLDLVEDPERLEAMADVLGAGDRARFFNARLHREMMGEVRWSAKEVERTRDGVDVATLELTPTDLAGMRLVSSWKLMRTLRRLGGGQGLERPTRKALAAASAVGRIIHPGSGRRSHLEGGRVLQAVWIEAQRCGFYLQPMTAILYLWERIEAGDREGLEPSEVSALEALRARYHALLPAVDGHAEIMLFRLARCGPPSARSLRRPVEEIFEDASG